MAATIKVAICLALLLVGVYHIRYSLKMDDVLASAHRDKYAISQKLFPLLDKYDVERPRYDRLLQREADIRKKIAKMRAEWDALPSGTKLGEFNPKTGQVTYQTSAGFLQRAIADMEQSLTRDADRKLEVVANRGGAIGAMLSTSRSRLGPLTEEQKSELQAAENEWKRFVEILDAKDIKATHSGKGMLFLFLAAGSAVLLGALSLPKQTTR